jgi:UPF0755 protein
VLAGPPAKTESPAIVMRKLLVLFLLLLLAAGGMAAYGWWAYRSQEIALAAPSTEVTLERALSARGVAEALNRQGVPIDASQFAIAARLRGDASKLRAGSFALKAPLTMEQLFDHLIRGPMVTRDVRFIEGWTFTQLRGTLDAHADLKHDSAGLTETQVLQKLGVSETRAEGLFYPDTYVFTKQTSDLEILRLAYRAQKRNLEAAWSQRAPDTPLKTPYELLVLASIVEKETAVEADRTKVAAVFVNRLRKNMLLQSDPTTIYGLGEKFDGNLRKRDLQADTPYNTYTRAGLPPTPISLPGQAALKAVANPGATKALYFVSRGDGTSEFSETLSQHNRAVDRYQRGR